MALRPIRRQSLIVVTPEQVRTFLNMDRSAYLAEGLGNYVDINPALFFKLNKRPTRAYSTVVHSNGDVIIATHAYSGGDYLHFLLIDEGGKWKVRGVGIGYGDEDTTSEGALEVWRLLTSEPFRYRHAQ
jgi:hypothetical protein